jgi:hypothetical protein
MCNSPAAAMPLRASDAGGAGLIAGARGDTRIEFADLFKEIVERVVGVQRNCVGCRTVDRGGGRFAGQVQVIRGISRADIRHGQLAGSTCCVSEQDAVAGVVDAGGDADRQAVDRVDHIADRLGLQDRQVHRALRAAGIGNQKRAVADPFAAVVGIEQRAAADDLAIKRRAANPIGGDIGGQAELRRGARGIAVCGDQIARGTAGRIDQLQAVLAGVETGFDADRGRVDCVDDVVERFGTGKVHACGCAAAVSQVELAQRAESVAAAERAEQRRPSAPRSVGGQ